MLKAMVAVWFGVFAVAIAVATSSMPHGHARRHAHAGQMGGARLHPVAAVFLRVALAYAGHPPLWNLGLFSFCTFFCCGILFGNYNAMAMEPVGHIAGMAAAISGTLSTLVALAIGTWFGQRMTARSCPWPMPSSPCRWRPCW